MERKIPRAGKRMCSTSVVLAMFIFFAVNFINLFSKLMFSSYKKYVHKKFKSQ